MESFLKPFKKLAIRAHNRYEPFVTTYPGFACSVIDKSSFLAMHGEIFEREIYRFESKNPQPVIIDCGANIGLSAVYFKKLFPDAIVTAFEPDPKVFSALEKNVKAAGLSGVTLVKKGLGKSDAKKSFFSEGADGGRISDGEEGDMISIDVTRLSPYLQKPVDFLKIDIEGSELEVLEESAGVLGNAANLFVEYHSFASRPQDLARILEIISAAGFRYYIESVGIRSEFPFIKREESLDYDLQLNIFCYRKK